MISPEFRLVSDICFFPSRPPLLLSSSILWRLQLVGDVTLKRSLARIWPSPDSRGGGGGEEEKENGWNDRRVEGRGRIERKEWEYRMHAEERKRGMKRGEQERRVKEGSIGVGSKREEKWRERNKQRRNEGNGWGRFRKKGRKMSGSVACLLLRVLEQ